MKTIWTALNIKLISLLLAVCAVLAVIAIAEWVYAEYSYRELLTSIEDIDEVEDEVETLPEIKLAEKTLESYSHMVNRPLFTEGRKPVEETNDTPTEEFTGNIELELTGVVETPEGVTAMLRDKLKQKNYRARKGDNVEGWDVDDVLDDKVIVRRGANRKELPLRKPRPQQAKPPKLKPPRRARSPRKRTAPQMMEENDEL